MDTRKTPAAKTSCHHLCRRYHLTEVTLLALILLLAAACGDRQPEAPPETYRVRGLIRKLPVANRSPQELSVRHEAISEFKDADGKVVGMDSMTMPFPLASPELISGLEVGDRIEMQFDVRWDGDHPLEITVIEALPPGTRLAFEPPAPEEPAPALPSADPPSPSELTNDDGSAESEPPIAPDSSP